jgi:hypothetical protein
MFTATFSKSIFNGESLEVATSVAMFTRKASLPFAPMPGIHLFWGYDIQHALTKVVWDFDDEVFVCDLADEFHQPMGSADYDFEGLVQNRPMLDGH